MNAAWQQMAFDFDVEQREPYYFEPGEPRKCRDCHKTKFRQTYGCGGARPGLGLFELCDDCARDDLVPGTDRSRWGITR